MQAKVGLAVSSPAEITSDKVSGSKTFLVKTGYSGTMASAKGGLKEAAIGESVGLTASPLTSTQLKTACTAGTNTASVRVYPVTVPANTVVARFALFQGDSNPGDDHDMGLLAPNGTWYYSGNDGSNEAVQVASPAAGNYKVCVVAYGSNVPTMNHRLNSWVVTRSDVNGKFTVAVPGKVVAGANTTVGMSWSGLEQGKRYVGAAQFMDQNGAVGSTTVLRVETGVAGIPASQAEKAGMKTAAMQ